MNKIMCSKRRFLKYGVLLAGSIAMPWLSACAKKYDVAGLNSTPDSNGLLLPPNCRSRIIARAGNKVGQSDYPWHSAPDGAGVLPVSDGGWIYLSNSEMNNKKGGVGVIRFNSQGDIVTGYPILTGTSRNCGGCLTPWNTWLSCEEVENGIVWECDPFGNNKAIARPNLGVFNHESIAIDPETSVLYLTEDEGGSCFYRYIPASVEDDNADLSGGVLEVALVDDIGNVEWKKVEDPLAKTTPTRKQVSGSAKFNGGEGIVYHKGKVYFDTKGDNRIWIYDIQAGKISIFYDASTFSEPVLTGVDTIAMYDDTLLACEDGGDMQIVAITPKKEIKPILQLVGHDESEITGVALSPDKSRLYFNSQRGSTGKSQDAITYEVMGNFI